MALMSVATMAAGLLVPGYPYVGMPLAAFALGWVTYRFGPGPAALLAVLASAVVGLVGPSLMGTSVLDGLFVAVVLLAIGPVSAILLRRYSASSLAIGIAGITTAAYLVSPIGNELLVLSRQLLAELLSSQAAATSVTDPAALKAASDFWLKFVTDTWPASSFYTFGLSTAISIPFIARAARSLGQTARSYGPLADLDLTFHVVWPTILGLGLTAAGTLWPQTPTMVSLIGQNALMIVRPLLFIQGAAVFASLYRRMNAGRLTRAVGLVLLCITELFVPSISVLGAVDLFANLRKLARAGTKPAVTAM
jgi:hypothetical protein